MLPCLSPIIPHGGLFRHYCFESNMLADRDLAKQFILTNLDCLQPHHFQQRKKHTYQSLP